MRTIQEVIDQLSLLTVDQIVALVKDSCIKNEKGISRCSSCPIARFFRQETGLDVYIDQVEAFIVTGPDSTLEYPLPQNVRDVIVLFDKELRCVA